MSRKKVWNSIIRRKKKIDSSDESPENLSPQLRRVSSTVSRRGSQQRHTLDPELSSLRERDTNHLFVECELKSFSLPRGYPPEVIVTQDDQGTNEIIFP
ncbi:ras GTPase-activating protein raskol isoform X10 [Vespula maculifrons]|uniref:Ras GTPase-activating protein raskol isoform X10 n=1 Tax=Vespula maculifrons TaxID=7453 RepID=A0ABD2BTT9_VESMC